MNFKAKLFSGELSAENLAFIRSVLRPKIHITVGQKIMNWVNRFVFSTNHKDIGTLYLIFGGFAGIIGTMFSLIIRLEVSSTGSVILNSN